jgi:hypothetical protein
MYRFFAIIIIITVSGCSGNELIKNKEYRKIIEDSFSETALLAQNRNNAFIQCVR